MLEKSLRHFSWIIGLLLLFVGCESEVSVAPETARQMMSFRNLGLGYLEENNPGKAIEEFQKLTEIEPREALGFINIGLAHFRMGNFEQAERWLEKARSLEPNHAGASLLMGLVLAATQREQDAITLLEKALAKHPTHVRIQYQLIQYYQSSQDALQRQKAENYLTNIVNSLPANIAARLQLIELLLQNEKPARALEHMEMVRQMLPELPAGSEEILENSLTAMRNGNAAQAIVPTRGFHNILKSTPFFQSAIAGLTGQDGVYAGRPVERFSLNIPRPMKEKTGLPDALNFTDVTAGRGLDNLSENMRSANSGIRFAAADYDGDGDEDIFVSQIQEGEKNSSQFLFSNEDGKFSDVAASAGIAHTGTDQSAIFADYDNDGYLDLFIVNSQAHKLYRNDVSGAFRDMIKSSGIETKSLDQSALFTDLDLEGDLDIFIAAGSENHLYRNNADGTFTEIAEAAGISREINDSREAIMGDFDDDGDLDLLVINQDGGNRLYDNLRRSYFRDISGESGLNTGGGSAAAAAGDYNNDGYLDLFIAGTAENSSSIWRNEGNAPGEGGRFTRDAQSDSIFNILQGMEIHDVIFFDADNDGYLDILTAGTSPDVAESSRGLWLFYNDGSGSFLDASELLPAFPDGCTGILALDSDNDGDQDILAASGNGTIRLLRNNGGNINNHLNIRLAGIRTGSGKNNYFGIGAKLEVKAGDLYQMRVITEPVTRLGIGNRDGADIVRILWSNGVPQNHFNPQKNQTILEHQILKGSCPWLFSWNGERYEFITDVLWTSALGMPLGIMGKEMGYAFPNASNEYMKIRGEMLQPQNGKYTLQFTSELWEAIYLDEAKLMIVDHPDSIDIFVDEKFIPPPFPELQIHTVSDRHTPGSALDQHGNDLLSKIRFRDGEYIANMTPTGYQGIMEPHDLILDLGEKAAAGNALLFLHGWLFPTDASINVNISQTPAVNAMLPSLQVIDQEGNWKTVIERFGFPKGKNKTVIVDLSGKFLSDDRRVRIRTNMQIYWDHIFFATGNVDAPINTYLLEAEAADLHYRGYSDLIRETPYSPHVPDYETVTTGQKWRDLTGNYTRYGDVQSLLQATDNKYVIMNGGDEITLQFPAANLAELPPGWRRDFLFYNTGWVKDGDLHTAHGQTVDPLPFHEMSSYPYGSGDIYPEEKEYRDYRKKYNTREISTGAFQRLVLDLKPGQ